MRGQLDWVLGDGASSVLTWNGMGVAAWEQEPVAGLFRFILPSFRFLPGLLSGIQAAVAMKTSLDHLPESKRERLKAIAAFLQAEAPVEMVILFGSYARGG